MKSAICYAVFYDGNFIRFCFYAQTGIEKKDFVYRTCIYGDFIVFAIDFPFYYMSRCCVVFLNGTCGI